MIKFATHRLWILLPLLFVFSNADAAQIQSVKGKRALIQLEGLSVSPGTELFAMNGGKRTGILRVATVKGDRAIAQVLRGNVSQGMTLIVKSSGGAAAASPAFSDAPRTDRALLAKRYKQGFGILGGMAMSTASLTARTRLNGTTYEESLAMKGNSFNLKAIYDYHMSPGFTIRAATGLETLSTTASISAANAAVCQGSTSCTLSLNYLTFEGAAQFNLTSGATRVWAGAGYAFLMAMSKANNIANLEATSTNQALFLGGGADFAVGRTGYIPVTIEYGLFPFAGIQLSGIYLRAGYGWKF